jgi:hypothetical protein
MIDLDALESLAKAAEWTGHWYYAGCNTVECKYPPSTHNYAGQVDEIAHPVPLNVAEFIAAANPSVILDLCAEVRRLRESVDKLLAHCPDPECFTCGEAVCPHGEPLHFHHDGCPSCCEAV